MECEDVWSRVSVIDRVQSGGNALLQRSRFAEANRGRGSPHEPQWSNQQVDRVFKEGRLISFDGVSDKLQYPTGDEESQRPAPVEKEQRQRHDDHRYSDAV